MSIEIRGLTITIGDKPIVHDACMDIDDGERMQSVLGALRLERQPQVDQLLDVGLVADRNEYLHLVPVGFLDVRRLLHSDIVRPLLR